MKTLIWKELRENVRWLPVGLIIMTLVCVLSLPTNQYLQSGFARELLVSLQLIVPLMAFVLALLQSVRDVGPAAGAYLHHRRVSERQVFWAKAIAGFTIYAASVVPPLLILASWIAARGLDPYPMRPVEVVPALAYSLLAFSMHPATLAMMTRRANWWLTRWFPLVVPFVLTGLFIQPLQQHALSMALLVAALAVVALAWLCVTAQIFWRDSLVDRSNESSPGTRFDCYTRVGYLCLSSVLVVSAVVILVTGIVTTSDYSTHQYNEMEVDVKTNQAWLLKFIFQEDEITREQKQKNLGGTKVEHNQALNLNTPVVGEHEFVWFEYVPNDLLNTNFDRGQFIVSADGFTQSPIQYVYDDRGYLLGYQTKPRIKWVQTIAADGIYPGGELRGKPFSRNPNNAFAFNALKNAGYPTPLVDSQGMYLIAEDHKTLRKLIDGPLDGLRMVAANNGNSPRIIACSQGKFLEYRLVDSDGSEAWFQPPPKGIEFKRLRNIESLELKAELVQSVEIPAELQALKNRLVVAVKDGFFIIENDNDHRLFHVTKDKPLEVIDFSILPGTEAETVMYRINREVVVISCLPGLTAAAMTVSNRNQFFNNSSTANWFYVIWEYRYQTMVYLAVFSVCCLVSLVLVLLVARKYQLRRSLRLAWCLSIPLLGLAAPLAMIATYPRIWREACTACGKSRRVDRMTCEHCDAQWEPPTSAGIEIIDREAARVPVRC